MVVHLEVRRRGWRWVLAAMVVVLALVAAGWSVYVRPPRDEVHPADAILVLGGPGATRYSVGLEYALEGYAPRVVISNPIGSESVWLTDLCTHRRYEFSVSCFEPEPPTTRGEARELRRLAQSEGWGSVIVVTQTPHITRARYILGRCFDGELMVVDSMDDLSAWDWAWGYVYQTAGYIRAALQTGC